MGRKTVGKLAVIVCLDAFGGAGKRLYKTLRELRGGLDVSLLESFYEMPSIHYTKTVFSSF